MSVATLNTVGTSEEKRVKSGARDGGCGGAIRRTEVARLDLTGPAWIVETVHENRPRVLF